MPQVTAAQELQNKAEGRLAFLVEEKVVTRISVLSTLLGGGKTTERLQPLHQTLQQARARLDRGEQHVFIVGMRAVAIDAESIQRRDAHRGREIPVRSTTHSW